MDLTALYELIGQFFTGYYLPALMGLLGAVIGCVVLAFLVLRDRRISTDQYIKQYLKRVRREEKKKKDAK